MRCVWTLLLACMNLMMAEVIVTPGCVPGGCLYRLKCQNNLCNAGESQELQDALNRAYLGDVIELTAGQTWTGNFQILRAAGGAGWLTIRTSSQDMLPPSGVRVTPSHAPNLAKIKTPNFVVAFMFPDGSNAATNVRFTGIEIFPADTVNESNADLIRIGNNTATSVEELPTSIEFDRCWIHGAFDGETRNAIAANGRDVRVHDSYISEIKTSFVENHAFVTFNSPGPFILSNNYMEASAIGFLFGGAEPSIRTPMLPSGLDMKFNHITKPLKWYRNSPYFGGTQYANKNMMEWKVGADSTVRWNVFDHNFREERNDQSGAAILFNMRLPFPEAASWARTSNIQFLNNVVRYSLSAWGMLGTDPNYGYAGMTQQISIRNNLFQEIGSRWDYHAGQDYYATFGRIIAGGRDVVVENNTFHSSEKLTSNNGPGSGMIFDGVETPKTINFRYRNNVLPGGSYPFKGDSLGVGAPTINAKTAGSVEITGNVLAGIDPGAFQSCLSSGADTRVCAPNWFISNQDWDNNVLGWDPGKGNFRIQSLLFASATASPGADPSQLPQMNDFTVEPSFYGAVLKWNLTQPISDIPCVLEVSPDSALLNKRTFWRSVPDLDPAIIRGADLSSRAGNVVSLLSRTFVVGFDGEQTINGTSVNRRLDPNTDYYYRMMCGGDLVDGQFRTLPLPEPGRSRSLSLSITPPADLAVQSVIVQYGEKESGAPVDYVSATAPVPCTAQCTVLLNGLSMRPVYVRVLFLGSNKELISGSASQVFQTFSTPSSSPSRHRR